MISRPCPETMNKKRPTNYTNLHELVKFFDIKEITDNLDKLLLPEDARKRWKRMGEVFG